MLPLYDDLAQVFLAAAELVEGDGVFHVEAEAEYGCGATNLVISGIGDVLVVEGYRDAAPHVGGVVSFEYLFEAVGEAAIAQNEAEAAERKVTAVIAGDAVDDEGGADLVFGAAPGFPAEIAADRAGAVDFGIGVGLIRAFVPTQAAEGVEERRDFVLGVKTEAVLDAALLAMG